MFNWISFLNIHHFYKYDKEVYLHHFQNDLTREENARIKKIAKDRVICENFSGRMKRLFKIMELKYKWDENYYSDVFNICVALTNYHITKYPLRNEDGAYYKGVLKGYTSDAIEKKRKKDEQNKKYAKKKKTIDEEE